MRTCMHTQKKQLGQRQPGILPKHLIWRQIGEGGSHRPPRCSFPPHVHSRPPWKLPETSTAKCHAVHCLATEVEIKEYQSKYCYQNKAQHTYCRTEAKMTQ